MVDQSFSIICPRCGGDGELSLDSEGLLVTPCPDCQGTGEFEPIPFYDPIPSDFVQKNSQTYTTDTQPD